MIKKCVRLLCLLLALTLIAGCAGTGQDPKGENPDASLSDTTAPPEESYTAPPTNPPVQVVMPEYELSYSGQLADRITWQEQTENGSLQFSVTLSTGDAVLFTLLLNQAEGELVTMKENGAGERIPISFRMAQAPENLSEDDQKIFYFAQDMVNEIIESLKLK